MTNEKADGHGFRTGMISGKGCTMGNNKLCAPWMQSDQNKGGHQKVALDCGQTEIW